MPRIIIELCAIVLFVQISGEQLNNQTADNILIKNSNNDLPHTNKNETYKQCVINGIIKRIEDILKRQIKESESEIKLILKPQGNDVNVNDRKIRATQNAIDWNECATKFELEQHRNLETEHILAIKKELGKLQELIRLLRDQQSVLNMLTDFEKPRPKIDDEDDRRQLLELFKMLKNHLPAQAKIELDNHKMQLQTLEHEIESLRNGQAIFINENANKTGDVVSPDVVGAIQTQNHPILAKLKANASTRKAPNEPHNLHSLIENAKVHMKVNPASNPKVRANDDFLDNLQKLLVDNPEQIPDIKENPLDGNIVPTTDIEKKLNDLEKQVKVSQKMKQLEKKIKQMQQINAESKSIDDEDDLKSQLKKLQRQLDNMNKNKVESKSLDDEDILDELKNLQSAINDLKPKEDDSQSKIGGADIQLMLNKLIGVPVRPAAVPVATHSQLTPAQIQVLKRIMALKAGSNQHQSHAPSSSYGHSYNPAYSLYGENSYYGNLPPNVLIPKVGYEENQYSSYDNGPYSSYSPYPPYGYPDKYAYGINLYSPKTEYGPGLDYYSSGKGNYGYNQNKSGNVPKPYAPDNGGYGQYAYYGAIPHPPQYAENADKINGGHHLPHSDLNHDKYEALHLKPSPIYSKLYGTKPSYEHGSAPHLNGYEEQQFFRGYKGDESEKYGSDSSQSYFNSQENSNYGNSYAHQKMGELQTQIYTLQSVINNLNSPEYVQKPEDQQTIYELDRKITDLKGVVSNLAQDGNQQYYESDYNVGYGDKSVPSYRSHSKPHNHEDEPTLSKKRFRREAEQVDNTTTSVMTQFIQELSDIVDVIHFLSESLSEEYHSRKVRNTFTSDHIGKFFKILKEVGRVPRETNNSTMNALYQRLDKLMNFVDSLTDKISYQHKNCGKEGNCATESDNHSRSKRDTEDSDDIGPTMQRIWDAMGALLDNKLRTTSNSKSFDNKPQLRSSYYPPASYYQPGYYQQPYYGQPIYYHTVYDYEDKGKKDKTKFIKVKKDLKVESKFEKIFTKILEKILDKIVKAIPIIIRKLLGLEFDFFGEVDDGYGYGGVKKTKKFGIFSIIPMLLFKILTNISYFVKKLKKNTFIKTFLVPGFVLIATAGLIVFLIWWLSGDDSHDHPYYGYGGNIGYDNSYRNSINSDVDDDDFNKNEYRDAQSRSRQPVSTAYSSDDFVQKNLNGNPYPSYYKPSLSKRYDPIVKNLITLIQLVEQYPVLYDGDPNRTGTHHAWQEVANKLGEDWLTCKEKWKNIRTCYTRYLRKHDKSPYGRSYYLSPYLEFLQPYYKNSGVTNAPTTQDSLWSKIEVSDTELIQDSSLITDSNNMEESSEDKKEMYNTEVKERRKVKIAHPEVQADINGKIREEWCLEEKNRT
ncbi:hypothetical protein FQR65_LT05907 [Abscondita terminalis]|nr:hypothetical protein FQR65_LT05907 [Abscondita terminalis]